METLYRGGNGGTHKILQPVSVNPGNWFLELVLVMSSVTGENIWLSSRKRNKTSSQGRVNAYECLRELHSECLLFGLWS